MKVTCDTCRWGADVTVCILRWTCPLCLRPAWCTWRVCLYLLTYLLHVTRVKKFPAFYETRRFITAFTSARHLSQLDPVRSPTCHLLKIHLNIILPSTHGSSNWPLPLRFSPPKPCIHLPTTRVTRSAHLILDLNTRTILGEVLQIVKLIM